jgi:hypothetical protein
LTGQRLAILAFQVHLFVEMGLLLSTGELESGVHLSAGELEWPVLG